VPGRRNPPQAAKLDGGEIELGMPRKRPVEGTPRKMVQGGEVKFPFSLDCKRAYAARSAQVRPPAVAAKYDNPEDRADQQPYGSHERREHPRCLPRAGTVSRSRAATRMAPTTPPFKSNPSLCLLHSTRDEGAAGAVAVATLAKKKHGKNALGGLQTLKISNNFGAPGCRNPL
jgi:hypothetical protein